MLVHGGAHGAWCWAPTMVLLQSSTLAVDLPPREVRGGAGRNESRPELRTLTVADWTDSLFGDLDAAGIERAVLVGHSLGGLTIAEAARRRPERVAHLVFVSAAVPPEGRSVVDALPENLSEFARSNVQAMLESDEPMGAMPQDALIEMFANDMDDDQREFLLANVGTEALRPVIEPVTRVGIPPSLPKTFVRLLRDRSLEPARQDMMIDNLRASPGGVVDVVELDSGHDVMISSPHLLAPVLDAIAATAT